MRRLRQRATRSGVGRGFRDVVLAAGSRRSEKGAPPRPPDFIGVGAQKAGTTWFFDLLLQHPSIAGPLSGQKELHFFDPFWSERLDASAIARYHANFARPRDVVTGEWTPRYLFDPWVAPLLAQAAPDARILVLLRDPMSRLRSALKHERTRGALTASTVNEAIRRGLYAEQLERLYEHVAPDRVLVLQFEAVVGAPEAVYETAICFLGTSPSATTRLPPVPNAGPKRHVPVNPVVEDVARVAFDRDLRGLPSLAPHLDLTLWPSSQV